MIRPIPGIFFKIVGVAGSCLGTVTLTTAALAVLVFASFVFVIPSPAQEVQKKTFPEPRWVATDTNDANGAKFHTFVSKAAGEEVSYHLFLPPQYDEQASRRFPVIYWLHGLGGNERGGTGTFGKQAAEAMQ